jgi:hypothetical protein
MSPTEKHKKGEEVCLESGVVISDPENRDFIQLHQPSSDRILHHEPVCTFRHKDFKPGPGTFRTRFLQGDSGD